MKKTALYTVIILSIVAIVRWLVVLWKKSTTQSSLNSSSGFKPIIYPAKLRNDVRGSGDYNAIRIGHKHEGIDLECYEGQSVYAPFDGVIERVAYPYASDTRWKGLVLRGDEFTMKLFYVSLTKSVGDSVLAGQQIAVAQKISKKYGLGMTDHIHIELLKDSTNIDPTSFFL